MTTFLAGEELTADGLNLRPYFHAYQASGGNQSIPNNTGTAITMTVEIADNINGHSNTVNTTRYVPTVPGLYFCVGSVSMETNCTGKFLSYVRKNGAIDVGGRYNAEVADTSVFAANTCMCFATLRMNGITDYLELVVNHLFGSTKVTFANASDSTSFLICQWVAP